MMENGSGRSRKTIVDMEISTFEIPPSGEILVLGKRCPIGPQAAKAMVDSVAPDQFELVQLEDDPINGMLIKSYLFSRVDRKALIDAVVEESKAIMTDQDMVRIRLDVVIGIKRQL